MPLQFAFTCALPNGLHARPASLLEEVARRFPAGITLVNERTGRTANLKSVLAIVGTDTRLHDRCRVVVDGDLQDEALAAVATLVRDRLPACEMAPRVDAAAVQHPPLSPLLRDSGATIVRGVPGVPGIGAGHLVRHASVDAPLVPVAEPVEHIATAQARLDAALRTTVEAYDRMLAGPLAQTVAEIVRVHRAIARDPEFRGLLHTHLRAAHGSTRRALTELERHYASALASSGNTPHGERAQDVHDVCQRLLQLIDGRSPAVAIRLERRSILLADRLTPGQLLALDRQHLAGLALAQGGPTSHTVILAGSFGIPTLLGMTALDDPALQGEGILDAESGALVVSPTPAARRYYAMESRRLEARSARIRQFAQRPGRTRDGLPLAVHANIVDAADTGAAIAGGAEGIGLFRTEALFLDRPDAPGEDVQQAAFARALAEAGDRPVVFRTLDVGGDKPIAALAVPGGTDPFAGPRGAAAYPLIEPLFRVQVRALLRASTRGSPRILIPMVTDLDQVRWVKRVMAEELAALTASGTAARLPSLGAMIETPAAVALIDDIAPELDFFSIGSNDLLQSDTAIDRAQVETHALHDPLAPAFLALLKQAVDGARRHGRPIGLCGEMAADSRALPLLVGMGLDSLSMSPSAIPRVKALLPRLLFADCAAILSKALQLETGGEVRTLVQRRGHADGGALIDPDLVIVDAEVTTKAEALKAICDRLFREGRTARLQELEQAIWEREQAYSTGVGHGVAIPHCRTAALAAPALVVLKPRLALDWGSADGEPVDVVLFLGLDDSDDHPSRMRILATLARRLMHEDFRRGLQHEQNPQAVTDLINSVLHAESVVEAQ